MSHSPRRVKIRHIVLALVIAIAAFLLLVPTKVQSVGWAPSVALSLSTGGYADLVARGLVPHCIVGFLTPDQASVAASSSSSSSSSASSSGSSSICGSLSG